MTAETGSIGDRPTIDASRVLKASGWALMSRWGVRLLGLVSTLVLVRLLTPADFGIVGMAMIVVGFSEAVLEFGVYAILIHRSRLERADYDTAWTLNVIQGAIAALLTLAVAYPAAAYFGDPRITPVLMVMAVAMVIGSAENTGVVDFQRQLQMRADFLLFLSRKLAGVIIGIGMAVAFRSYWALVFGYAGTRLIGVAMSYWLHPFRPRISLARLPAFIGMSAWLVMRNVGDFTRRRLDRFIVGGTLGTVATGFYTIASELTEMLISELLAPVSRALLPAFAAIQHDPERLRRVAGRSVGGVVTIALPASAGLAIVAPDIVGVVLGSQWEPAVPLLRILALAVLMMSLSHTLGTLLTATGRVAVIAWGTWGQVLIFVLLWAMLFRDSGLAGVAWSRFLAGALFTLLVLAYTASVGLLRPAEIFAAIARPVCATAAMTAGLLTLVPLLDLPAAVALMSSVMLGAAIYTAFLLFTWILVGKPEGIESMAAARLRRWWSPPHGTGPAFRDH